MRDNNDARKISFYVGMPLHYSRIMYPVPFLFHLHNIFNIFNIEIYPCTIL